MAVVRQSKNALFQDFCLAVTENGALQIDPGSRRLRHRAAIWAA